MVMVVITNSYVAKKHFNIAARNFSGIFILDIRTKN